MKLSWQFIQVAVLCGLLTLSPYVNADDFDDALSVFIRGDYMTAYRVYIYHV